MGRSFLASTPPINQNVVADQRMRAEGTREGEMALLLSAEGQDKRQLPQIQPLHEASCCKSLFVGIVIHYTLASSDISCYITIISGYSAHLEEYVFLDYEVTCKMGVGYICVIVCNLVFVISTRFWCYDKSFIDSCQVTNRNCTI
ncbi:hypothetical protein Ahy_A10g050969 isoform A [Arachis hypogaea]|uniref:Uncharacterized protein n=1 Tax=Arachis hypogaea TaxID=3818 RepID=A0A445BB39_ARAHY|nr:hypothetical protein Ahy_A10g050969 isoform A [Arachis hypogaea]